MFCWAREKRPDGEILNELINSGFGSRSQNEDKFVCFFFLNPIFVDLELRAGSPLDQAEMWKKPMVD